MNTVREFSFDFSEAFIRRGLRRDVWDRGLLATGILLLALVVLQLWNGSWSWMVTGVIGAGIVIVWFLLRRQLSASARRVFELWSQQAPTHRMTLRFDENGFDVVLGAMSSRHVWQGLRGLWRYRDVWLIEIVEMVSVFFPPEAAPDEVRTYIVERCEESEVRIRV